MRLVSVTVHCRFRFYNLLPTVSFKTTPENNARVLTIPRFLRDYISNLELSR